MKKIILYIALIFCLSPQAKAQYGFNDMVELTGVVMSSDSLQYLPYASIRVLGSDKGTISSANGVFSLIIPKGTNIEFSYTGFKKEKFRVPDTLKGNSYSIIQLMVQDTFYLPTTFIRPMMSRAEFERAFAKLNIPPDQIEIARRNTQINTIRAMAFILPKDGSEHLDQYQQAAAERLYWMGGAPPGGITAMPGGGFAINPMAFAEFFNAWKRGDFKRQK